MATMQELVLHRVRFDDYAIDKKGRVRVIRKHHLSNTTAQVGRRKLSVWSRPTWFAILLALIAVPYSLVVMLALYAWTSNPHKEELRLDMIKAFQPDIPKMDLGPSSPPPMVDADDLSEEPKVF